MFFKSQEYQKELENIADMLPPVNLLKNKDILITGATGMIGSALTDFMLFLNKNYGYCIKIYALARDIKRLRKRFISYSQEDGLYLLEHNIIYPLVMDKVPCYIIHTASNAHPYVYQSEPVETLLGNVEGTHNMLELAKSGENTRMVFVSSGEIYGQMYETDMPVSEEASGYVDTMEFRSCYPSGKRAAETLCAAYAKQYNTDVVVARPCHIYGPTALSSDSRAASQFIRQACLKKDIVMKSSGLQLRSYCYVADCISAILFILLKGRCAQAYNIANKASNVTIREFAEKAAKYGEIRIVFEKPPEKEKAGYTPVTWAVFNPSKLEKLGWHGQYSIDTGIRNTIKILNELG